jgi:hypothetical protein
MMITMNLKKHICVWLTLALFSIIILTGGQSDNLQSYQKIKKALEKFTGENPVLKIYLHLDKSVYCSNERIWIKAYVVDGINHLPDDKCTNLYIEFISPDNIRLQMKRFRIDNGFASGDFTLSDTLPEGFYKIRAFTSWMLNYDEEFMYEHEFMLVNPRYTEKISPVSIKEESQLNNTRGMVSAEDLDVRFMPEGGVLVTGIKSAVALKITTLQTKGVAAEGAIIDDRGAVKASFNTNDRGIGTFNLKPEKKTKYYALIRYLSAEKKVELPQPLKKGMAMHIEDQPDRVEIFVQSNLSFLTRLPANHIIIIGQMRGRIYYDTIVNCQNKIVFLEIPKFALPMGIMQFTAFSVSGTPLAERLVFINNYRFMKIHFKASDTLTNAGIKTLVDIYVTDNRNNPLSANLSMSITREINKLPFQNKDNIFSNLILSSDLKEDVQDPLDYFKDYSPPTLRSLDNLMMTSKWQRFYWRNILDGIFPTIIYPEEKGIVVFGQVIYDIFNKPLKDCLVMLTILGKNDVYTQYTNKTGYFLFDNMFYYDTISAQLEARHFQELRDMAFVPQAKKENAAYHPDPNESLTFVRPVLYNAGTHNEVVAVYTLFGNFINNGTLTFDFPGYSKPHTFYQPKYKSGNEPVMNYTLVWKPFITTNSNGKARVVIDKPLVDGDYRFCIEGMSYIGHIGYAESVISSQ